MYRFIIATLVTICIAYIVSLASPSALAAPATKPAADDTPLGIAPPSKDTASTILPVTAKFTEYRDEKRGFKVSYPDGWKKRDVSKDTEFLEFVASEPDDDEMIVEVLRIGHLPVYAHSDLDGTVKRLKESFQRGPNGPFEFISEDDVKLAGNPAREIVMIGND